MYFCIHAHCFQQSMNESARIDKYLWEIRVFKTRSEATQACGGGKVKINGQPCKASRQLRVGEKISVRKGAALFSYEVLDFPSARVGAQLVENYARNLTPESEIAKLRAPVETFFVTRQRGAGRPTKKDRRTLDALMDSLEEN